ncbi:Polyadenylate-binding protein [Arachis hypogaea]|nr:Polyadenylate-binding protein [Arachis hypogaea]
MEATTLLDPQNSVTTAPLLTAAVAGVANASKYFVTMSLYIEDLDPEVDESLYDLFDQVRQVVSV